LAALPGGITTVLIPKDNEKDLAEIPDNVKKGLNIIPVSVVDEVVSHALTSKIVPINLEEQQAEPSISQADDGPVNEVVKH